MLSDSCSFRARVQHISLKRLRVRGPVKKRTPRRWRDDGSPGQSARKQKRNKRTPRSAPTVRPTGGIFSWILGVLCCWCVVCCPCDSRQVYNAPDGKKVLASGTPSGQFVEMC